MAAKAHLALPPAPTVMRIPLRLTDLAYVQPQAVTVTVFPAGFLSSPPTAVAVSLPMSLHRTPDLARDQFADEGGVAELAGRTRE